MKLIDVHKQFSTQEKCLDYLEATRWPKGVCCVECGSLKVSKIKREKASKNKATRLYQCLEKACGHQFSATSGTIFHDSHLPLEKWFLALALICEGKKSISANQMKRHLGVNYRTAWHLCHRIRAAMVENDKPLTGEVEADTTFIGPKVLRKGRPWRKKEGSDVVLGIIEREGRVRLFPVPDTKRRILQPVLEKNISKRVKVVYTDEHPIFQFALTDKFPGKQQTIEHKTSYVVGTTHTNTIENAFSLFKRALRGSFHHVSIKHLARYCAEFGYRFNRRSTQEQLFDETLRNLASANTLTYKALTASPISA